MQLYGVRDALAEGDILGNIVELFIRREDAARFLAECLVEEGIFRSPGTVGSGRYPEAVRLDVGDVVVYPAYGVGRVVAREKRMVRGAEQAIVVLELADGLSVELPMRRAREQLRQPVSETGVLRVQETLREDGALSADGWLKRRKQTQEKLMGGDPLELAEVVRDGARRTQTLAARGTNTQLSPSEKTVYDKARKFLSEEIGLARSLDPADADAWIEEQIAATGS